MNNSPPPDLDAIARNLSYLDLAHLTPEESAAYEHELSAIAALNEAIETVTAALNEAIETVTEALQGNQPQFWQQLYPLLSDAAALLTSQLAPLLDTNAERSFPITEQPIEKPLALAAQPSR